MHQEIGGRGKPMAGDEREVKSKSNESAVASSWVKNSQASVYRRKNGMREGDRG